MATIEQIQNRLASVADYAGKLEGVAKNAKNKLAEYMKDWSGQAAMAWAGGAAYAWASEQGEKSFGPVTLHGGHALVAAAVYLTRTGKYAGYRAAAHGALGAMGADNYRSFTAIAASMAA